MGDQLANNPEALRLFFTEDIYLVPQVAEELAVISSKAVNESPLGQESQQKNTEEAEVVATSQNIPSNLKENIVSVQEPASASVNEPASRYNLDHNKNDISGDLSDIKTDNQQSQASHAAPELNFVFRGKNARNILILVYDEVNEVTTEAGREVFKNIVKAKDLLASDYAIVNFASYKDSNFSDLKRFFNAKAILTFGVGAAQLGLGEYPQHKVITHEGVRLMFSADLHELSMDMNIKRALWTALKEMEL